MNCDEPGPGLVEHAERAVAGVDELDGGLRRCAAASTGRSRSEPIAEHGVEELAQAAGRIGDLGHASRRRHAGR